MRNYHLITFLFLLSISTNIFGQATEIETLKTNYRNQILKPSSSPYFDQVIEQLYQIPKEEYFSDQIITDLMQYYPQDSLQIRNIIDKIDNIGKWTDIDYEKKNRSRWYPQEHAERIYTLTIELNKENSPFYRSEEVENTIHNALNWWFEAKLKSPNWWHNQIGVPKLLGSAMILFEPYLTDDEKSKGILYLSNSKIGKYTGQNKVWLAGINFAEALLSNDLEKAQEARDKIVGEITVSDKEGIKLDHSFQQHGAMLQFANYGGAFIVSNGFWSKVFNNTSLAIEQDKLDILANLFIEGYGKVTYNGFLDTGVLARQYFHNTQPHKGISLMINAIYFSEIDKTNSPKYIDFIETNLNKTPQQLGIYHFWQSDYTVNHHKEWMASIRMASTRVLGGESLNGDNKRGYYTGDGATFLYNTGDEYLNIFPNWDWKRLPGVTCYNSSEPIASLDRKTYKNNSSFVGNVNDGEYGISVMRLNRDDLQANKFWLLTPDFVLALGNSISSDSICDVTTSIEQNINREPLMILKNNEWTNIDSIVTKEKDIRIYHNKTGYILLGGETVIATNQEREGKWNTVMNLYPDSFSEKMKINNIWIDHGISPEDAKYAYILLPNTDKDKTKNFDLRKIDIIQNDDKEQIVKYKDYWFIASQEAIDLKLSEKVNLKSNTGGLFMISENGEVYYSDPTQQQEGIKISLNDNTKSISFDNNAEKGKSICIKFKK